MNQAPHAPGASSAPDEVAEEAPAASEEEEQADDSDSDSEASEPPPEQIPEELQELMGMVEAQEVEESR